VARSPDFLTEIQHLWQALGGNPRNRALVIAHLVATYAADDAATVARYADQIAQQTPLSDERKQALDLLKPSPLLARLATVEPHTPLKLVEMVEKPATALRIDPEIGRLCIALDCAAELRLWVVAREMVRTLDGRGMVTRQALRERLAACGVGYTPRHFNRLLEKGAGRFWIIAGKKVYLRSITKVSVYLVETADAKNIPLGHNRPGVRDSLVDVSGTIERWEAMLYAAWVAYRSVKHELIIARATLSSLFNRHPNSIRRWEEKYLPDILDIQTNFAQCPDAERYFDYIPDHAQPYVAQARLNNVVVEVVRLRWQLPNRYSVSVDHSHAHRGQARHVRRAVNAAIPAPDKRGGHFPRYLASHQHLRRHYRSKRLREATWEQITRPLYYFIGVHHRTKHGMYEISNRDFGFTQPNERLRPYEEQVYFETLELRWAQTRQAKGR
jgi:hypothetical protein